MEALLAQTINLAVELKLIKPQELTRVIVDSTVQHKAIAHPTDSRLLEMARNNLVEATKDADIELKQTFAKEGKELCRKAGRYAHARQFKRMHRAIKRLGAAVRQALGETLEKATRIVAHSGQRKAMEGSPKPLCLARTEVDCISKGKAKQPYELGVKGAQPARSKAI